MRRRKRPDESPDLEGLDWLADLVREAGRRAKPVLEPKRVELILRTPQVKPGACWWPEFLICMTLLCLLFGMTLGVSNSPKSEAEMAYPMEPQAVADSERESKSYDWGATAESAVDEVDYIEEVEEPELLEEVVVSGGKSLRWNGRADRQKSESTVAIAGSVEKRPPAKKMSGELSKGAKSRSTSEFGSRIDAVDVSGSLRSSGPGQPLSPVNPFVMTEKDALSTFALESEMASYVLSRRHIQAGYRPPPGLVRMEEFVNAFDYNYPGTGEQVFRVHTEAAPSPFGKGLALVKIGVRGKVIGRDGRKPAHLVFVIDASGSMARADRLPLVRESMRLLLGQLGREDRVSLISYDTQAHLLLESVPAVDGKTILNAIDRIACTAATNVLDGLMLGYELAGRSYRPRAVNRIILCSDGVANVGPSDAEAMLQMVDVQRKQGIAITTVGVGAGSYNDGLMEQLANRGDGNYVYIDSPEEARRVFVDNFSATLNTIAKDVKIQVAFDPKRVRRYRLIGYENRDIADHDFRNDAVDAGEIGSGQSATALYEVELHRRVGQVDLGTVFVRYKDVGDDEVHEFASRLRYDLVRPLTPEESPRFFLAAAVAEFAEYLRGSEHARDSSLHAIEQLLLRTSQALPRDGQIAEFLDLVRRTEGAPTYSN